MVFCVKYSRGVVAEIVDVVVAASETNGYFVVLLVVTFVNFVSNSTGVEVEM